jgi:gas vesicle protein
MKSEVTIALFGLGGTVLGALIGAVVSAVTARQQAQMSLKQLRLETLRSEISELKNALSSISSVTIDVSDSSLTSDQIMSRSIDSFLRRATLFKNISYLFPVELEDLISRISEEINRNIFLAKTGIAIDELSSRTLVNQIPTVEKEIDRQIRERMRSLHSELSMVTFSRRHNKH